MRGDIVAVQVATVVQIVQARWRCHSGATRCWPVGQVVDHVRRNASGSVVELLLRLQVGLVVAVGSVLVHVVVRVDRYVVVVELLLMKLRLLFVNGVVSGVNVNVSEIAIASVATAAAVGCAGGSIRIGDVSIVALDLLIDGVLLGGLLKMGLLRLGG